MDVLRLEFIVESRQAHLVLADDSHYGLGVESPLFGDSDEISQDFSLRTNEFRMTTLIFQKL
jgi:hypothetical protein